MTAAELIAQLQTVPPDTRVFVRFYEDGLTDADMRLARVIIVPPPVPEWDGPYAEVIQSAKPADFNAVVID